MMRFIVTTAIGFLIGRWLANRTALAPGTVTVMLALAAIVLILQCVPPIVVLAPLIAARLAYWHALRP